MDLDSKMKGTHPGIIKGIAHIIIFLFPPLVMEIREADVRIQKPRMVYKAASIALEFESKISHTRYGKGPTWAASSKTNQHEPKGATSVTTSTNSTSKPPLRISDADRQSRYLKGECYRCGVKYGPGHRCKTDTLKVLEVGEEFEEQPNNEVEYVAGEPKEVAEISLHAILGKPHPRTMKVQGMLQSTEVIILIDGGSTHNFISYVLVKDLKLNTQAVAPLGEADLVLGIQWLETLNTLQANWKEMFMIFRRIADKYPIPNIDELLDELYGATVFSKLDLRSGYHQIRGLESDNPKTAFCTHSGIISLSGEGVQVEQDKVALVQSWPIPSNVKEVRGFLGLTGYYRRFVQNYGLIARPLTSLTKKDGFVWSGAILSQEEHPVAYFSKGFSSSNRFKSAYDRELLVLVLAVLKWSHYLLRHHFLIRTDHYTLKFLLEQRITSTEQHRLLLKLMPYDFSISHSAGKENRGADALSRKPHSGLSHQSRGLIPNSKPTRGHLKTRRHPGALCGPMRKKLRCAKVEFTYPKIRSLTSCEDSPVEVGAPPLMSKPTKGCQKRTAQNEEAPWCTTWINEEKIALCKVEFTYPKIALLVTRGRNVDLGLRFYDTWRAKQRHPIVERGFKKKSEIYGYRNKLARDTRHLKAIEYHEWLLQQEAQPRLNRTPIFRDREDAERRLRADYFDDHCNTADAFDEYLKMSEQTARDAIFFFNMCIIELYMPKYLRKPTSEDVVNIQQKHSNVHGFQEMLGSIDCMHWEWKNCPVAWHSQYGRGDKKYPTIMPKAVASQDLWIWHAFFGIAGANNDIKVLDNSPLFDDLLDDLAPAVSYMVNGVEYRNGYYLADGIYPEWTSFVKSFTTFREDSPVEVGAPPLMSKPTRGRQKMTAQNEEAPWCTTWINEEKIVLYKVEFTYPKIAPLVTRGRNVDFELSKYKEYDCFYCNQKGHIFKSCPVKIKDDAEYKQGHPKETAKGSICVYNIAHAKITQNKNMVKCFKCQESGHFANKCPPNIQRKPKICLKYPEFIHFTTKGIIKGTDMDTWDDFWIRKKFLFTYRMGEALIKDGGNSYLILGVHYAPEITLNILSISPLKQQGFDINFEGDRCTLEYMFKNQQGQNMDMDRMRQKHNDYLDEYFKSLDKERKDKEDEIPRYMEDIDTSEVYTFNDFVAFLNLIKNDEIISKGWDIYRKRFDKGGYLNVYFGQEFSALAEILGLTRSDGEEIRKCYMTYLEVFVSYYKTARAPEDPIRGGEDS
nr:protein ALP1-like [Tanacetum cinerariifolium]